MRQKPNTKLIAAAVFPLLLIGTLALINHQSNDTPYSKLASDTSYTLSLNIANTPSALEQGTYSDLFGVKPSRETAWDYIQAKDVAGGHVLLRGNSSAPGTLTNVSPISGLTSMTALVSGAPLELYGAYELGDEYQLIKTLAIGTNSHNFTVGYPYLQFVATGTTNDSQITMLAINYSCVAVELTGLSLSVIAGEAPLDVGETLTLAPTLNPLNATNGKVSWTSNNPHIASVTGGIVSALSVGSATITATAVSNPTISADFTVSVNALPVVGTININNLTTSVNSLTALNVSYTNVAVEYRNLTFAYSNDYVYFSGDYASGFYAEGALAGTSTSVVATSANGISATFTVTVSSETHSRYYDESSWTNSISVSKISNINESFVRGMDVSEVYENSAK